jgi:hypothetical protein
VSHLRGPEAERWCLDQLAIPRADLGTWPSDAPFWVRLRYVVAGDEDVSHSEADVFTIRRLIDVFSRRSAPSDAGRTIDAGPFPLPD